MLRRAAGEFTNRGKKGIDDRLRPAWRGPAKGFRQALHAKLVARGIDGLVDPVGVEQKAITGFHRERAVFGHAFEDAAAVHTQRETGRLESDHVTGTAPVEQRRIMTRTRHDDACTGRSSAQYARLINVS